MMKHLHVFNNYRSRYLGIFLLLLGLFNPNALRAQQKITSKQLTQKEQRALPTRAKAQVQASEKTSESEIVMSIAELESLLTKIAAQRKATLAARASMPAYTSNTIVARATPFGIMNPDSDNGASASLVSLHRKVDQLLQQSHIERSPVASKITSTTSIPAQPLVTPVTSIGKSIEGRDIIKATSIYFANNSVNLTEAEKQTITNLVPALQQQTDRGIIVLRGFASKVGNAYHNNQLSFNRANAIKEVLMHAGVKAEKIMILYHGADPATPDSQARRVDVSLELF
ncbi:MAG: OmpA family protein [Pedobacter sp.]|nr:MAG: OmpA family protein [Pedobacter sp.]